MKNTLLIICLLFSAAAFALPNDARVPVLLYHSATAALPCDYGSSDVVALEADLQTLHDHGYTSVPAYWLVEWALGRRDGSTLPDKVVAITIDDGYDGDFLNNTSPDHECAPLKSVRQVLEDHANDNVPHWDHPRAAELTPHASLFVIGSRLMREEMNGDWYNDNWWGAANAHAQLEIYNHGWDHDHPTFSKKLWDEVLGDYVPVGGHDTGDWTGRLRPDRIRSTAALDLFWRASGFYIRDKIGAYPDLLAYPMGRASEQMKRNYRGRSGAIAAFCTEDTSAERYLRRGSDAWCLPRITKGAPGGWNTPEQFLKILRDSGQ